MTRLVEGAACVRGGVTPERLHNWPHDPRDEVGGQSIGCGEMSQVAEVLHVVGWGEAVEEDDRTGGYIGESMRGAGYARRHDDLDRADAIVGARTVLENAHPDRSKLDGVSGSGGGDVDGGHGQVLSHWVSL